MTHTIQNIGRVLNPKEKKQFYTLLLGDVLVNVLDILFLAGLLWVIQYYIQPAQTYRPAFLPPWLANRDSVLLIALFVLLFGVKNFLGYWISKRQARFVNGVAIRISYNNLLEYQRSSFDSFVNTDSSVHIRNICFRPFDFCQYMLSGLQQIITQLSLMAMTVLAILLFNAKLFLLLLLVLLPPVSVVFWFVKKKLTAYKKDIQQSNEHSFRYVLDALKGYVEGNIYHRNDFFLQRFIRTRRTFSTHLFNSLALQNLPARIIEVFAVLGLFVLVLIAKYSGNNSGMLITIGAFMAAAYKIIPGMVKVINLFGQMRAYEFAAAEPSITSSSTNKTVPAGAPGPIGSIGMRHVYFKYGDRHLLHDFSTEIQPGDFLGISGESGRGKTTLFNLLLGFLPVEKGAILFNGIATAPEDIQKYWPQIAYVRQQGFFIHDTVLRNITLEETAPDQQRLTEALQATGLDEVLKLFPEGLEKMITENGKNISGGQQQRIAIARAIYKNAPLILLDEPFNELDEEAAQKMLAWFKQAAQNGKTVLMITHDKKSLGYCNKIISLDA